MSEHQTAQAPLQKVRFAIDTRSHGCLVCNLVNITAIDSTISLIKELLWLSPGVERLEVEVLDPNVQES